MSVVQNPTRAKNRVIWCRITLQSGVFNAGNNTAIINNATINARIHKSLSNDFTNSADITIDGLNESDIAAISTLGFRPLVYQPNKIEVYAQYEGELPSLAFSGFIIKAYADLSDTNRPLHLECQTTYQTALKNFSTINVNGTVGIEDIFKNISSVLGHSFQNNGVTGSIENPIFTGSPIDQLKSLSEHASVNCVIDNDILKICPKGWALIKQILNVNSTSGLLGYPTIDDLGVKFRMRYNPSLQIGQYVALQTSVPIPKSNGQWFVYDMQSSLNNRHENWYTDLRCSYNYLDFSG